MCNSDKPSVNNYLAVQNNSVGAWLTAAGYHTAFIGKYVNGLEHTVPSGWNFWGGFSSAQGTCKFTPAPPHPHPIAFKTRGDPNPPKKRTTSPAKTDNYFNSTPYNVTFDRTGQNPTSPVEWVAMTGTHQSDFVGQWGVQQMGVAVKNGLPFFVHLTPLMIHCKFASRAPAPRPNQLVLRKAALSHTHTRPNARPRGPKQTACATARYQKASNTA